MFLALLDTRLKQRIVVSASTEQEKPVKETSPATKPVIPKKTKKGIVYDPVYDPPPPLSGDPLPPPEPTDPSRVLAAMNFACVCNSCNKVVYIVNQNIHDGCKVTDFVDSFTPTPGHPKLELNIEIQNLNGKISTDCPACGAHKTLYLT